LNNNKIDRKKIKKNVTTIINNRKINVKCQIFGQPQEANRLKYHINNVVPSHKPPKYIYRVQYHPTATPTFD